MIVLFDFDGVIADTLNLIFQNAREASVRVGVLRIPTREDVYALEKMEFDELGRHLQIPEEKIGPFTDHILALFREDPIPLPVFDGMMEVLTTLSEFARIGIVTGNSSQTVEKFLLEKSLSRTVQVILGSEYSLTKEQKVVLAAEKLGDFPSNVYLVGDAKSDIVAARKAGAMSIAVAWGNHPVERLRSENPDQIVYNPQELLTFLKERYNN